MALVEELDWFEGLAADRGLNLGVPPLAATRDYAALLSRLDAAPYDDAVGGLWVIERVYLDAWSSTLPGADGVAELVEHWTTPGFAAYVAALQALSEQAGPPDEALVVQVLDQEAAFWQMALDGPDAPAQVQLSPPPWRASHCRSRRARPRPGVVANAPKCGAARRRYRPRPGVNAGPKLTPWCWLKVDPSGSG